jgi:putative transposase
MKKETRLQNIQDNIFSSIKNLYEVQQVLNFDQFSVNVLEALMLLEREEFLKSPEGAEDIGNGTYKRSFKSLLSNGLQIQIPRTRNGSFKPVVLEFLKVHKEQVNDLALDLYQSGLSTRSIEKILARHFGEHMSRDTINNLASKFSEIRKAWENTKLCSHYKTIYCDATFVPLRRGDSYSTEAVYICYGVRSDNKRDLLAISVVPTESAHTWDDIFKNIKKRGVEKIDLAVSDGLTGFDMAFKKNFPGDVQRCVVHLQRNILNKIRPKEKAEFSIDLKKIFCKFDSKSTKQAAFDEMNRLIEKWSEKYSFLKNYADKSRLNDYFTYIDYPPEVRKHIYTTNSIESLNFKIKQITKTKLSFEREDNMIDLIFMIISEHENDVWKKYPVRNFEYWPEKKAV